MNKVGDKVKVRVEVSIPKHSGEKIEFKDYPNGYIDVIWFDPDTNDFKVHITCDGLLSQEDWDCMYSCKNKEK